MKIKFSWIKVKKVVFSNANTGLWEFTNCLPTNLYVYQLEYCSWCWDTWDVLFQLASLWWWQAYCCGTDPAFPIYKGSIYARETSLRSQRGFGCDSDWSKTIGSEKSFSHHSLCTWHIQQEYKLQWGRNSLRKWRKSQNSGICNLGYKYV